MAKLVNKITTKLMGFSKGQIQEMVMADKKKEIELYHIVGGAFKATVEDSQNGMGEYVKLAGSFKGINALTGEIITSGVCILPDVAANAIAGMIAQGGEKSYAEVALTVTVKYEESAATSYVFGAHLHNDKVDAFEALEALIPSLKPALPNVSKNKKS